MNVGWMMRMDCICNGNWRGWSPSFVCFGSVSSVASVKDFAALAFFREANQHRSIEVCCAYLASLPRWLERR